MANYTLQNAYDELEALIDSEYSVEKRKEEILSIIKKLDAKGEFSSNKTVFYDFGTGALGEVERSDPNVRQVGKTDIGKFVFHLTDIEQGTKTELLKDVLQINELSDAHTFINGSYENGMWYTASEKFAKETTGVRIRVR